MLTLPTSLPYNGFKMPTWTLPWIHVHFLTCALIGVRCTLRDTHAHSLSVYLVDQARGLSSLYDTLEEP